MLKKGLKKTKEIHQGRRILVSGCSPSCIGLLSVTYLGGERTIKNSEWASNWWSENFLLTFVERFKTTG